MKVIENELNNYKTNIAIKCNVLEILLDSTPTTDPETLNRRTGKCHRIARQTTLRISTRRSQIAAVVW